MAGSRVGPYEILAETAQDGTGTLYRALQPSLNRSVSIKVLPLEPDGDPDFRDRFRREASEIAALRHPNILFITDFGEHDGAYYMVTELTPGGTLRERLSGGPLDPAYAATILTQVAAALDYAHDEGLIHGNLKPANILLHRPDWAVLTGFEITHTGESGNGATAAPRVENPEYASPEQARGLALDRRSDIYSLGVIAYQMLTGGVPFGGGSPTAIYARHVSDPPPSLRRQNPVVTPAVERVVLRALAKRAVERFTSAGEFAAAFQAALRAAPPPPPVAETNALVPVTETPAVAFPLPAVDLPPPAAPPRRKKGRSRAPLFAMLGAFAGLALLMAAALVVQANNNALEEERAAAAGRAAAAAAGQATAAAIGQATAAAVDQATAAALARAPAVAAPAGVPAQNSPAALQARTASSEYARTARRVFGPQNGRLDHRSDQATEVGEGRVNLRDFIAEARFFNPYDLAEGGWDYGFFFRDEGGAKQYRLHVRANRALAAPEWSFRLFDGNVTASVVGGTGTVPNLDTAPRGSNLLRLVVREGTAYFFINDLYIATLDVSRKLAPGDVVAVTGAVAGDKILGRATVYEGFAIWALQ
jgi:serine/threonine-protein kinase